MPADPVWLTERLAQIEAPPARDAFYADLRARLEHHRATVLRRWKLAAIASAIVAIGGVSATAVLALTPNSRAIDRTLACAVPEAGGVHPVSVVAQPNQKPSALPGLTGLHPNPAMLLVGIRSTRLVSVLAGDSELVGKQGFLLDATPCTGGANVRLAADRLPLVGTSRANDGGGVREVCWIGATMRLRIHVDFAAPDKPTSARLAVSTPRGAPVAYVEWSPSRVRAYASRALCHSG